MASAATFARMDDLEWPRVLNRVITQRWSPLKNTLVMKDFVDYLIQKRVVTLDYWIGLKSKPVTESERTEDFLAMVMKFDQQKYQHFLEALLSIHRDELVRDLLKAQKSKSRSKTNKPGTRADMVNRESKRKNSQGQTDAEAPGTKPTSGSSKLTRSRNSRDGHNGSQEAFSTSSKSGTTEDSNQSKATYLTETDSMEKSLSVPQQAPLGHMTTTDKLHRGIGTAVKPDVLPVGKSIPNESRRQAKEENEHKNKTAAEDSKTATTNRLQSVESAGTLSDGTIRDSDSVRSMRPDTAKSKEDLLNIREREIQSRESELEKKAILLNEQEEQLKKRETELITRENSLLTIRPETTDSMASPSKLLREIQHGAISASSTTESSDMFADVREQLAAMKRVKEEVESEHTTRFSTPKEEYVKLQDFQASQRELGELKDELATDRSNNKAVGQRVESLQHKVEDLKQEIGDLQSKVDKLQKEKDETKLQLTKEVNKLKAEMTNTQKHNNERIGKLQSQMKIKDNEYSVLKSNIEDVVKTATELEDRVEVLENDKSKQEQQLKAYQKEISFLQKQLQEKEAELTDLKKVLEDTEIEKDELIEDLTELKKEVTSLKAQKRQLEQDKRTLLGRCAKPNWNQTSSRRTSFK